MKAGIEVTCTVCGRRKAPIGRSVHAAVYPSYCTFECEGYHLEPYPGSLWPGETEEEFGYPCNDRATSEEGN